MANLKKAVKAPLAANKKNTKINETAGDKILNVLTSIILILIIIIVGYPTIFVISCSFSSHAALTAGQVYFLPVDFSLRAYEFVLEYKQVWIGFRNSVFYTFMDVLFQMTTTILVAYPLSKKNFQGRGVYTWIFYFTTMVGAGLIPSFLLKCSLGLYDNIWAVLLSGSLSVSHIIMLRTAISSNIPGDLFDAAKIDGASEFQSMFMIALPLVKATLSVLVLYCIVGQWNEYFTCMIYLKDENLYSLQLVLRPIMTAAAANVNSNEMSQSAQELQSDGLEGVRYALIIISSVPPIAAYFVVQKYFKGGVMLGSVKG